MVSNNIVGGVCDPERCGCKVCLQHAFTSSGGDDKVILYKVVCLNSVFQKYIVSNAFIPNVVDKSKVVCGVYGDDSGIRIMYRVVFYIRVTLFSDHVKVYSVPSQDLGLSRVSEFSAFESNS